MKPRNLARRAAPAAVGRVRIIGGRLRGSRLDVPDVQGLRPTSDRVRETLFNWLAPGLSGARCLDLFAGSGALGFEAVSRGAAEVAMIERDPTLAAALAHSATRLGAATATIIADDAMRWLQQPASSAFDVVFVDPPFGAELHAPALAQLPRWLAQDALIYVESGHAHPPPVPPRWQLHREGHTREVRYALYRSGAGSPDTLVVDSVTPVSL
jgi:16S rRNA (guanine966-N2)-methyltransferase